MKKNSTILFCDETGFTGANLLDGDQPYFVYSSVNIEEELACQYLADLRKKIGYQASEFKAKNALSYNKGRKELLILLEKISPNIKFVFANKKYALACKFFEYIFEPCLQEQNRQFYDNNFHRFIASFLYISFQTNQVKAISFLENFLNNMKLKTQNIELFFNVDSKDKLDPVLKQIEEFVLLNQSTIRQEFQDSSIPSNKWRLDLTDTFLASLLCNWHTEGCSLEVYCDESKPLQDNEFAEVFENFDSVEGYLLPSFKLSKPINFVKSEDYKGIQLADLVSGAVAYALKNNDDDANKIKKILFKPNICCMDTCIVFDEEFMDLSKNQVKVNVLVLEELVRRSKNNKSLTDGIFDLYQSLNWLIKHTA